MAYPDHPLPLLTLTGSKAETMKWNIPDKARSVLESIEDTITAVSIAGKYRGGMSYLMNVIGGKSGYNIDDTIQAQNKGIWMWPVKHSKEEGRCLLLLDPVGLHDEELDDSTQDMQLFVFALLMSSCIIYNITGPIDNTELDISELQMVTELTENIRVRGGASNDEEDEEEALAGNMPELVVAVRDFHLEQDDGNSIKPAEYFESVLKPKIGASKKVTAYNLPRRCIREYFQRRTCFILSKPVQDDSKIKNLENLPKEELEEQFINQTEQLAEYILTNIKTMTVGNQPLLSQGFLAILEAYVNAVNNNGVPCVESAIESMKKKEQKAAFDSALTMYLEGMKNSLEGNLPMETSELVKLHTSYQEQAAEKYKRLMRNEKKPEDLYERFEREFETYSSENHKESLHTSKDAISKCFEAIMNSLETNIYHQIGGHAAFIKDLEDAQSKYNSTASLGPLKDEKLKEKMDSMNTFEDTIINYEKALRKKEEEVAKKNQELEALEIEAKRKQKELDDKNFEMQKQIQEQEEMLEKYQKDQDAKAEQKREQREEQIRAMKKKMADVHEQRSKQEAEKLQARVKALEEERLKAKAESDEKTESLQKMKNKLLNDHREMMDKMSKQHYERLEIVQSQQRDAQKQVAEKERRLQEKIVYMPIQHAEQLDEMRREQLRLERERHEAEAEIKRINFERKRWLNRQSSNEQKECSVM